MARLLGDHTVTSYRSSEEFLHAYLQVNPFIERIRRLPGPSSERSEMRLFNLPRSQIVVDNPCSAEFTGSAPEHFFVVLPLGPGLELSSTQSPSGTPYIVPYGPYTVRVTAPGDRLYFVIDRALAERDIVGDDPGGFERQRLGLVPGHRLELFQAQMLRLLGSIDEAPQLVLDHPRFRAAQEELLFLSVAHAFATERPARAPVPVAHRRALDFIEAHFRDDIRLADVAAAAGLSVRTLQSGFRHHNDTTLTRHIRQRRLAFARQRLTRAEPGDSVTSIALESGFNHLGEFSLSYRAAFGETPSDTLRQSRACSRPHLPCT